MRGRAEEGERQTQDYETGSLFLAPVQFRGESHAFQYAEVRGE